MSEVAGFTSVFHIWSTRRNLQPHVIQHPGIHIYHDKSSGPDIDQYNDVKRKYAEARGSPWYLSNKRPERLRDTLNELEELLEYQYVAYVVWRNSRHFQIVLSNCAIVSVTIATDTPDIERLFIDKSLTGKLTDYVFDGIVEENYMVFTFLEKPKLMVVNYAKRSSHHDRKESEKLSFFEPKISMIDLPGPSGRRVKRHCLHNLNADLICLWWANTNEEAWPWSPIASDSDRANLVMLSVTGISSVFTIDIAAYVRTDGDMIDAVFSHKQQNQLLTIEQSQSSSAKFLLDSCVYELIGNKISRVEVAAIPIKTRIICQCRNYKQNKIALVSSNSSLILWDEYKRKARTIKLSFNASHIAWHPGDTIFVVSSSKGYIQIFDIALNSLSLQLLSDTFANPEYLELHQYFFTPPKLKKVFWAIDSGLGPSPDAVSCGDDILLIFERGPVGMLRLELGVCTQGAVTPIELVCEYIKYEQLHEAVTLLNSLNWNTSGSICFQSLVLITDHIFRKPFNAHLEACLEDALGSFYAPIRPLAENTILQHRDDISRLARRFFHHLLRHKRFEKAFLLAVDIGAKDLFMDIHYLAIDVGNIDLAQASKERAMQIHYDESNEGFIDMPPDVRAEDELLEINYQLEDLYVTSNPSRQIDYPSRRYQRHIEGAVQYDFDDSDDDRYEDDPIAWALASRSGKLQTTEQLPVRKESKDKVEDLKLVHFGNV